jgi:hypothetical protein
MSLISFAEDLSLDELLLDVPAMILVLILNHTWLS